MSNLEVDTFEKFVLIGDKVLVKPKKAQGRTKSGLYLPPGVEEKEKVQSGFVIKVGPGYPLANAVDPEEAWKGEAENLKYVPLQAQEGDLAIYLQDASWEIEFNKKKYMIVPHNAILMLIRDNDLFE